MLRTDHNAADDAVGLGLEDLDADVLGESRQAKVFKCVPPWLKPVLLALWGPRQSRPDARSLQFSRNALRQTAEPEEAEPYRALAARPAGSTKH